MYHNPNVPNSNKTLPNVALVGAGPGDPDLLTFKAHRYLGCAQVVLFDNLVHEDILALCSPDARMIDVGKIPGKKATAQQVINALLVKEASAGHFVVRLKGGDPFVFGRGSEEALALVEAGLNYDIVPGISSCLSVPLSAGIPVTHRGITQHFSVITGMSAKADQSALVASWKALAKAGGTLVFLMGVRQSPRIVAALLEAGLEASTPAAFVQEGTRQTQRVVTGTLEDIVQLRDEHQIKSPAVLVVGEVVGLQEQLSAGLWSYWSF